MSAYFKLFSGASYRSSSGSGAVILDDCNFHESVRLDSFDVDRTLSLVCIKMGFMGYESFFLANISRGLRKFTSLVLRIVDDFNGCFFLLIVDTTRW